MGNNETTMQDKMKDKVKEVSSNNFEIRSYLCNKSIDVNEYFKNNIRVEDLGNYYILWLYGIPSFNVSFIFDKNGNLLIGNKNILGIDKDNFFVFDYDINEMSDKLYHYQIRESNINLVNVLDNIVDVDYCDFFDSDLVVCCSNEDKILYNYKNIEVVIPSFSSLYNDLGNFDVLEGEEKNCIRVVKKLYGVDNYKSILISNLEFLVDKKGKVVSYIADFENGYWRFLNPNFGDTQEEMLDSVYSIVSRRCKLRKRLKKQN